MIYSIDVTNFKGETINIDLFNPEASGLLISDITGITPMGAQVNTTNYGALDGAVFNSARIDPRQINIMMYLLEKPTIEITRQEVLYRHFPLKKPVKIRFNTDRRSSVITGYVESVETPIFTDKEQTNIQILCPDPFFYEDETQYKKVLRANPEFEFPFSNESLTEKLICFGDIFDDPYGIIKYEGDGEIGCIIHLRATGNQAVVNPTLYDVYGNKKIAIDTAKIQQITQVPFYAGDEIIISSVAGKKYMKYLHAGVYQDIMNAFPLRMTWFTLKSGNNFFGFKAEENFDDLVMEIEYVPTYEGV